MSTLFFRPLLSFYARFIHSNRIDPTALWYDAGTVSKNSSKNISQVRLSTMYSLVKANDGQYGNVMYLCFSFDS